MQLTFPDRSLPEFLKDIVQAHHEGCAIRLAGLLGITKGTLSGWISGAHRPEFSRLLQLAELYGCNLEDALCGRSDRAKAPSPASKEPSRSPYRRNPGDINWKKVIQRLHEAMDAEQPASLADVAVKVGVSADTLRNREPQLCQALSNRWLNWRKIFHQKQNLAYAEQVRMEAMRLANQGVRPSWQRVLETGLPPIPIWKWRAFVQDICDEAWKRTLDSGATMALPQGWVDTPCPLSGEQCEH
jgi:transcriptional regulator with XRE-family HTH domain